MNAPPCDCSPCGPVSACCVCTSVLNPQLEAASQHLGEARSRLQASASSAGPERYTSGVPGASSGTGSEKLDGWAAGGFLNESRGEPTVYPGEGAGRGLGFSRGMDALHAISAARTLRSLCSDDVARSGLPLPLPGAVPHLDSAISVARRALRSVEPKGESPLDSLSHLPAPDDSSVSSSTTSTSDSNTSTSSATAVDALGRRRGKVLTKWGIYADVVVDRRGSGDYKDLAVSDLPSHKSQARSYKPIVC